MADGSGGNGDKEGMARAKRHAHGAEIHRDGAEDRRHQKEEERDQRQRVERACPTGNGMFDGHACCTSPANEITRLITAGATAAAMPAACRAEGVATSRRTDRLNRHFAANARRRIRCSVAWGSSDRRSSVRNATAAASSAPQIAKRSPSPVIGSMKPAASPARSNPGTRALTTSTARGPRTTGGSPGVRPRSDRPDTSLSRRHARAGRPAGRSPRASGSPRRRWRARMVLERPRCSSVDGHASPRGRPHP